jgi:hypothetical protein
MFLTVLSIFPTKMTFKVHFNLIVNFPGKNTFQTAELSFPDQISFLIESKCCKSQSPEEKEGF